MAETDRNTLESPRSDETHKSDPHYGPTIALQKEKEEREKAYNLDGLPHLMTTQMKVMIGICEVLVVATIVLIVLWSYFFGGLSTQLHAFGGNRLCFHAVIFIIGYSLLIPHIILGSILLHAINPTLKKAIMISLKFLIFGITIGVSAEAVVFVNNMNMTTPIRKATIYSTHGNVVSMMSIVEIVYIIVIQDPMMSSRKYSIIIYTCLPQKSCPAVQQQSR